MEFQVPLRSRGVSIRNALGIQLQELGQCIGDPCAGRLVKGRRRLEDVVQVMRLELRQSISLINVRRRQYAYRALCNFVVSIKRRQ